MASLLAIEIHSGSVGAAGAFFLALRDGLHEAIVKLSHASLAFHRCLMLSVVSILVFYRLRRKHQAVIASARLSHVIRERLSASTARDEPSNVLEDPAQTSSV
jgi:hypothetical protein